jgi:hypothetical protein
MKAELLKIQSEQMKSFRKELTKEQYSKLAKVVKRFNFDIDFMLYGEELSIFVTNNIK